MRRATQELAKTARSLGEEGKVSIRNVRKSALDKIKKLVKVKPPAGLRGRGIEGVQQRRACRRGRAPTAALPTRSVRRTAWARTRARTGRARFRRTLRCPAPCVALFLAAPRVVPLPMALRVIDPHAPHVLLCPLSEYPSAHAHRRIVVVAPTTRADGCQGEREGGRHDYRREGDRDHDGVRPPYSRSARMLQGAFWVGGLVLVARRDLDRKGNAGHAPHASPNNILSLTTYTTKDETVAGLWRLEHTAGGGVRRQLPMMSCALHVQLGRASMRQGAREACGWRRDLSGSSWQGQARRAAGAWVSGSCFLFLVGSFFGHAMARVT